MTSSVLNFSVSHKTCLARTNGITIIVTSRELHTWYTFLSSFLARMLFNFVAKKISNEIVFCVDFSIAPFNLKIKKIGKIINRLKKIIPSNSLDLDRFEKKLAKKSRYFVLILQFQLFFPVKDLDKKEFLRKKWLRP